MDLNRTGPPTHRLFSIDNLYCFGSMVGSPRIWRADCTHWSTPFYTRDLRIHRLWNPWGGRREVVLEPIPGGHRGTTKLRESQFICGFSMARRLTVLNKL